MSYRDDELAQLQCELAETRRQRDKAQERLRRIDEATANFRASQVEPKTTWVAKPKPDGLGGWTAIVLGLFWLIAVVSWLHVKVWVK